MSVGSRIALKPAAVAAVWLVLTVAARAQEAAGPATPATTPAVAAPVSSSAVGAVAAPATSSITAVPLPYDFKGNETFVTVVVALIFLFTILALVWFRNAMIAAKPAWSLADALSEDVVLTPEDANGPRFDPNNKALMATELKASSSRLIAFVGAIVSVFLFLGFGTFSLYQFGMTGQMPGIGDVLKFLAAGSTLFVPYTVNKLSSLGSP